MKRRIAAWAGAVALLAGGFANGICAEFTQVEVPRGTRVLCALAHPLDIDINKLHETVDMAVSKDVTVNGAVVIKKGAPATGRITLIQKASEPGKDDTVVIDMEFAKTVDGQRVLLEKSSELIGNQVISYTARILTVNLENAVSTQTVVPEGTPVMIRLDEVLSSGVSYVNKAVAMSVAADVLADGKVVIKEGTPALGRVRAGSLGAGRFGKNTGSSSDAMEITVDSTRTVDGQRILLQKSGDAVGSQFMAYTVRDVSVDAQ